MSDDERQALADLIREHREAAEISASELARRAGIDKGLLTLLDQKKIAQPKVDTLRAIAQALDIPIADMFATTNWLPQNALPSLQPYMRAKYEDLPDEAVAEVEQFIANLSTKYRRGPQAGEDE